VVPSKVTVEEFDPAINLAPVLTSPVNAPADAFTVPSKVPDVAVIAPVTAKLVPSNVSASLLALPILNLYLFVSYPRKKPVPLFRHFDRL
jgi:hypothetical protein